MEMMLEAFKTSVTSAKVMKLLTPQEELARTGHVPDGISDFCGSGGDFLVLDNIVQQTSEGMRTVLLAKVAKRRTDYLFRRSNLLILLKDTSYTLSRIELLEEKSLDSFQSARCEMVQTHVDAIHAMKLGI